ncbi:hypothetical protein ACF0H5_022919 [Mactra antiquata]
MAVYLRKSSRDVTSEITDILSSESIQNVLNLSQATKKHPCEYCGKLFKTNWERKRHTIIHTGERPFKCEICDFRCSLRHHLKSHLARHFLPTTQQ